MGFFGRRLGDEEMGRESDGRIAPVSEMEEEKGDEVGVAVADDNCVASCCEGRC